MNMNNPTSDDWYYKYPQLINISHILSTEYPVDTKPLKKYKRYTVVIEPSIMYKVTLREYKRLCNDTGKLYKLEDDSDFVVNQSNKDNYKNMINEQEKQIIAQQTQIHYITLMKQRADVGCDLTFIEIELNKLRYELAEMYINLYHLQYSLNKNSIVD